MSTTPCLHCAIHDAIEAHFRNRGDLHGDEVVLNTHEVLGSVARIVAEILAGEEEPILRGALYDAFCGVIREEVGTVLVQGSPAKQLRPS